MPGSIIRSSCLHLNLLLAFSSSGRTLKNYVLCTEYYVFMSCILCIYLSSLGFLCGSNKSIALILRSTTCINKAETFIPSIFMTGNGTSRSKSWYNARELYLYRVVRHCSAFDWLSANRSILLVMMTVIRANPCRPRSECAPYKGTESTKYVHPLYVFCTVYSIQGISCKHTGKQQHVPVHRWNCLEGWGEWINVLDWARLLPCAAGAVTGGGGLGRALIKGKRLNWSAPHPKNVKQQGGYCNCPWTGKWGLLSWIIISLSLPLPFGSSRQQWFVLQVASTASRVKRKAMWCDGQPMASGKWMVDALEPHHNATGDSWIDDLLLTCPGKEPYS